ncbi:hypothetical protein M422DRAFT_38896 [Sphaerobolus stellatus SS14]|uniref:Borealin N-terminal domain-containing protein n=1 Tax=Sphaerobolus stellatus (strain SS14) TaxID=990650 RepID=A0A0C9UIH7_SPHS4|nr:hypothetical protein M422DRAFT_38896 [Sphaerobolus stellatus SS14]
MATTTATMQTPPRRQLTSDGIRRRKYTDEEKKQLLANLELEVKDRIRQFEAYLAHSLEAFKLRHENEVTRIPRAIRTITIGEFADKYDGDVNIALKAITKAKMVASEEPAGIEDTERKRKWQATDVAAGQQDAESPRALKTARLDSPQKRELVGRPRIIKTPARLRKAQVPFSPNVSPQKSPEKQSANPSPAKLQHHRVPSSTTFNPLLPKTPAYPRHLAQGNASPFTTTASHNEAGSSRQGGRKLERQRSIAILRGPGTDQAKNGSAFEMILSLKVPTLSGRFLEFDPLSATSEDIDAAEGVSPEAIAKAKEELLELSELMKRLGKWRI